MKRYQIGEDTKGVWGVFDETVWSYIFHGTKEECIAWGEKNAPGDYVLFE